MKLIKAFIRQRKMEEVFRALKSNGFCCMTMAECEGTGHYSDHEKDHISTKYPYTDAYRVIKLEVLIPDSKVNEIISVIRDNARTGYRGDGMIIVSPVDNVYKVKNESQGIEAL
ncbi:MAG: P-II family nitrogen regulator [Marinilabiliales bacterium]|nr:MAG: P-II family nitrogen regulator [Marinilabiliales bacterium]